MFWFARRLRIEATTTAPFSVSLLTDQPGGQMSVRYSNAAVFDGPGRRKVTLPLPGTFVFRMVQAEIAGTAALALYRVSIEARSGAGGWQWHDLWVYPTPEQWTTTPLPIEPTPENWNRAPLPIEPTPEGWNRAQLPIRAADVNPVEIELPMDE